MAQKLQLQLKEVGSKLETPPSTKDSLVKLLKITFNDYDKEEKKYIEPLVQRQGKRGRL